ncbi:MAG: (2Fe-2S)-binding protein [Betaproteobacteria bacterium]|nr:(2Fe-2S)-binding protein [Betaproteobacteria bacterium]MBI2959762.1 (2Fe-2S)-binding protein [Betaproteobacteria bacterium]
MLRLKAGARHSVTLKVNGRVHTGQAESRTLLSDFLRHELKLFGTRVGCEHGVCGACTVMVDGRAVRSCMQYAVECDGSEVRTVEGLAQSGMLNRLQQAFHRRHALQCGFCTPGILMSATHFLQVRPDPTEAEVRDMLSGHICRCTGYYPIVRAILEAAESVREERS